MTEEFDYRYHCKMRRSRAAKSLKHLKFNNFKNDYKTDEEAFKYLINERMSYLAHYEDQSNHAVCTALCSAVEGCPWSLHAMTKSGVENDYPTAVEVLTDYIQKFDISGVFINNYSITYSNNSSRNPYPTLEMKQQT